MEYLKQSKDSEHRGLVLVSQRQNNKITDCALVVPCDPHRQQRIVTVLDSLKSKVDLLQSNFEKISQECDALKQAILQQVFE